MEYPEEIFVTIGAPDDDPTMKDVLFAFRRKEMGVLNQTIKAGRYRFVEQVDVENQTHIS